MPIYEYECTKCGKITEKLERNGNDALKECPECSGEVTKLVSPPMIQFKGSGWYITDYQNKDNKKKTNSVPAEKAEKKTEAKKSEKKKPLQEAKAG